MTGFFDYSSPYRTPYYLEHSKFEIQTTFLEDFLPFVVLIIVGILIFKYREKLRSDAKLDKRVRIITGIVFALVYLSHYILRFAIYKFDTIVLPFQLCSISMFLAILFIFKPNKSIYAFVFYTGFVGALISYFTPLHGYNAMYYRYYQFYIAHGILILTPVYFVVVHNMIPTKQETIKAFIILQSMAVFMVIFNYFAGTDFMFVFINADKITKFPAIAKFGGIPLYLLWVEIAAVALFTAAYIVVNKIFGGDRDEII